MLYCVEVSAKNTFMVFMESDYVNNLLEGKCPQCRLLGDKTFHTLVSLWDHFRCHTPQTWILLLLPPVSKSHQD